MLEITRLHEITSNDFKNTIDKAIKDKHFIRNGILNTITNLTVPEQFGAINHLLFNPNKNCVTIKTIGNIEWTPIKLYDTAYYMVNIYGKLWLISHNSYDGFIIKYNTTIKDYIFNLFNYIKDANKESLSKIFYPSNEELYYAFLHLDTNKLEYVLIKQMTFGESNHKINHYFVKVDSKIYYFPISTFNVYKPILYSVSLSN